jgi:gliding motility-associated lipoprotein GldD
MLRLLYVIATAILFVACGHVYSPRPYGYFRIELPQHEYEIFDVKDYPYSFEAPKYARVLPDTDDNSEPYWINLSFPKFNCKIHVTYKPIKGNFDEVMEDSRRLAYKHTIKADAIGETFFENDSKNVYGILYDIKGNAATPLQFALTDSSRHLFRGSLYFDCKPNKDSLAPVVKFLEEDIAHIMETLTWR